MAVLAVVSGERGLAEQVSELVARFGDEVKWFPSPSALGTEAVSLILARTDLDGVTELITRGTAPVIALGDVNLRAAYAAGVVYAMPEPYHPRELLSQIHATLARHRRVVCLGGGAGLSTILLGLKRLRGTHLTAVVNVCDDGGSSGRLREELGILPPGDIRRSLVALSSAPRLMNDLMEYRFAGGAGLKDHSLGNLLVAALDRMTGSFSDGVRAMGDLLNIQGIVLPASDGLGQLCAERDEGGVVHGECRVGGAREARARRIVRIWVEPRIAVHPSVESAILAADLVTLGPGDLFTSVLVNLAVEGMTEALRATRARVAYVCNLMTKPGETADYAASDHVRAIVEALGPGVLHHAFLSRPDFELPGAAEYAAQGQHPVTADVSVVHDLGVGASMHDLASRSYFARHDPELLAEALRAYVAGA